MKSTHQQRWGWDHSCIAKHNQIFKANKREHFERLKKETGIEFSDMIFFDNQANNINDVSKLGVHSVLCPDGMLHEIWTQGLESFQRRQKQIDQIIVIYIKYQIDPQPYIKQ